MVDYIPPAWKNFPVKPEKHLVFDALSTSNTSSMYNIFTMLTMITPTREQNQRWSRYIYRT